MVRRSSLFAVLALLAIASPARSERFDFIYVDRMEVRFDALVSSFTLNGSDFGLIVNRDAIPFDVPELSLVQFDVVASAPQLRVTAAIHPENAGSPIVPKEAVGSVTSLSAVLPPLVAAGETFRNTTPAQFLYLTIERGSGGFPATVQFNITMRMGQEVAEYVMVADVSLGAPRFLRFTHASRTSSTPVVTGARASSWGRIKSLYR